MSWKIIRIVSHKKVGRLEINIEPSLSTTLQTVNNQSNHNTSKVNIHNNNIQQVQSDEVNIKFIATCKYKIHMLLDIWTNTAIVFRIVPF